MKTITTLSRFNLTHGIVSYASYAITLVTLGVLLKSKLSTAIYLFLNLFVGIVLCVWLSQKIVKSSRALPFLLVTIGLTIATIIISRFLPTLPSEDMAKGVLMLPIFILIPMFAAGFRYRKLLRYHGDLTSAEQQSIQISYGIILTSISIAAFSFILGLSKLLGYLVFHSAILFNILICIFSTLWMIYLLYRIDRKPIYRLKTLWYIPIVIVVFIVGLLCFAFIHHPQVAHIHYVWTPYTKLIQPFIFLIITIIALIHYNNQLKLESNSPEKL